MNVAGIKPQYTGFALSVFSLRPVKSRARRAGATCVAQLPKCGGVGDKLAQAGVAVLFSSLLAASAATLAPQSANAVISEELCINGEGPGCEAMSGGNPYIRELQERSRKNKEKHSQELLERYWTEGYGSYFSFGYNKQLKKDPETGEWSLVTPDDLITKAIRRAGIIPDMD